MFVCWLVVEMAEALHYLWNSVSSLVNQKVWFPDGWKTGSGDFGSAVRTRKSPGDKGSEVSRPASTHLQAEVADFYLFLPTRVLHEILLEEDSTDKEQLRTTESTLVPTKVLLMSFQLHTCGFNV